MKSFLTNYSKKLFITIIVLFACSFQSSFAQRNDPKSSDLKLSALLNYIRYAYVDTVNEGKIVEKAIVEMMKELDPHSIYFSKEEMEKANEPLVGGFDGVGIQFQLFKDTILVIAAVPGGPSDKLGIRAGDKIVKIDSENSTGSKINNNYVMSKLRGKKGTKVTISIKRGSLSELIDYTITRDKIPINSIDAAYMATSEVGYIRLDRFAQTTMEEYFEAMSKLKAQGMKSLIFDLRGNSGGYLQTAIDLADEFLENDKLIVYTEGTNSPMQRYNSTAKGGFEKGKLIVLIDEGSASASEIVSGAVQDWDRALIIGRRSFGKGLVQKPFDLPDGSVIRLTTSRYHTPTGRCIQKSYAEGTEDYMDDFMKRYKHGEFVNSDSIKFPDSLKFYTPNKRLVYGGGGIMPDIFVPLDTTNGSEFLDNVSRKGLLNQYVLDLLETKRDEMKSKYPTFKDFMTNFQPDLNDFIKYAESKGVKRIDSLKELVLTDIVLNDTKMNKAKVKGQDKISVENGQFVGNIPPKSLTTEKSDKYLANQLKAIYARNLFDMGAVYQIINETDDAYLKALEVINNDAMFKKMKIRYQ
ncbi:MAG: S41 family peptidase [Bacteroidota bacterium]